jgi:hypothetical protein
MVMFVVDFYYCNSSLRGGEGSPPPQLKTLAAGVLRHAQRMTHV